MGISIRRITCLLMLAVGFWGQSWSQEASLTWNFEDLLTDQRPSGANPEFLIDARGNFHLSYWDRNRDRLVYGFREANSDTWTYEWVDSTLASGFRSTLFLDEEGIPHIAYLTNIAGNGYLKYGFRNSQGWQTETIPISSDLGIYGYNEKFPEYTQASLDLIVLPNGSPLISYFDGSVFGRAIVHCSDPSRRYINFYDRYDLFMGLAYKEDNTWNIVDSLDVPHDGRGLCLVEHGDRFGEFNNIWVKKDGSLQVFTNSMHNNELLMFSGSPQNLSEWEYTAIDSVKRFAATGLSTGEDLRETFDYIQYEQQSDSLIHLVYGFSELYGNVSLNTYSRTAPFTRRSFFYVRAHPDSLGMQGYQPNFQEMVPRTNINNPNSHDGHYRAFFTLNAIGDDSLFIGHYNFRTSEIVFHTSTSGGVEWETDTLGTFPSNSPLRSQIWQDSLHVMFYETLGDRILWASRHLNNTEWNIRPLLPSQVFGEILESTTTLNQTLHLVFNDVVNDQLYAGQYVQGDWNYQPVDLPGKGVYSATILPTSASEVMLAYSVADSASVKVGFWQDTKWQCSIVDTNLDVRSLKGIVASDSIFLIYLNLSDQQLHVAKSPKEPPFEWNISLLEGPESDPTGDFLEVRSDLEGNIYLTYRDLFLPYLKFAVYKPGSSPIWEIDTVSTPDSYFTGKSDIGIFSDGRAAISFRDQINNSLVLAEQNEAGEWEFSFIPTEEGNLVGIPVKMLIDEKDQLWILYSLVSNQNELHLTRRDSRGRWEPVNLTSNTAQLGQNYSLEKSGGTLYIIGRKTQLGNRGLGILFAEDVLPTPIYPSLSSQTLRLWPNPVSDQLYLEGEFRGRNLELEIFDLAGKRVLHKDLEAKVLGTSPFSVPVGSLPKGVYVCSLRMGSQRFVAKFVK